MKWFISTISLPSQDDLTNSKSNFDNWLSNTHFVSFLFHYYCICSSLFQNILQSMLPKNFTNSKMRRFVYNCQWRIFFFFTIQRNFFEAWFFWLARIWLCFEFAQLAFTQITKIWLKVEINDKTKTTTNNRLIRLPTNKRRQKTEKKLLHLQKQDWKSIQDRE